MLFVGEMQRRAVLVLVQRLTKGVLEGEPLEKESASRAKTYSLDSPDTVGSTGGAVDDDIHRPRSIPQCCWTTSHGRYTE
jgi:hypothetical protein